MKRIERLMKRKKIFNRIYSSILAIVISASILNYNKIFTLANDPSSSDQRQVVSQAESMQTSKDGMIDFIKSIKQTSNDNFDISLEVVTKDKIKPPVGSSVVLLIDNSSSMNALGADGKTLLDKAKEAAKEFTNILLEEEGNLNEIGIAVFNDRAARKIGFTNNKDNILNSIDSIGLGSTTNIHDGLYEARYMLEGKYPDNAPRKLNSKYIVLLSDGEPNYSYKGLKAVALEEHEKIIGNSGPDREGFTPIYDFKLDGFTYYFSENIGSGGNYFFYPELSNANPYDVDYGHYDNGGNFIKTGTRKVYDNGIAAISEGFIIKNQGIDIHSIFLTSATGVNNSKYEQAKFTISNIASKGEYLEVNDVEELTKRFQEVSKEILEKTNIWKLTDPMGDYVEFNGFPDGDIPPGVSFKDGVLTWSMLSNDVAAEEFIGPDNLPRYRYKLTYKITLNRNKDGFLNYANYPANGRTFLNYYIGNDFNPGISETLREEFIVPVVTGGGKIEEYITVKPLDMIAYQGGNSASGDTFPRPYFTFKKADGTVFKEEELKKFKFYFDGEEHVQNSHDYYIYEYPFRAYYKDRDTGVIYNDPNSYSEHIGFYDIELTTMEVSGAKHTAIAVDEDGKVYGFNLESGTLEVRPQNFLEKTAFTKYQIDDISGDVIDPTVVVPNGTIFLNSAGIKVEDTSAVSLMKDQIFDQKKKETMESIIESHSFTKGMSYILKYLDLVDHNDGNIIVTAHKDDVDLTNEKLTVYYPYPKGTDDTYTFRILHFKDVKRTDNDEFQNIEEIVPEKTDKGLKFTVDSFSPFAIAYKAPIYIRQVIVDENLDAGIIGEGYVTIDKGLASYNKYIKSGGTDVDYTTVYFDTALADNFKVNPIIPTNYTIDKIAMKRINEQESTIDNGEFELKVDEKVWITIYIRPIKETITPWSVNVINNDMGNISLKKTN